MITTLAFPVAFAEGAMVADFENGEKVIKPEILSDMDNYMRLNSPKAIDKTNDYLVVANDKRIFVQPQKNKRDFYYIEENETTLNNDQNITQVVINGEWILVLTKLNSGNTSIVLLINAKTKVVKTVETSNSINSIAKYKNQFAINDNTTLKLYNVENNELVKDIEISSNLSPVNFINLKIFNDIPYYYYFENEIPTIQKCKIEGNQCSIANGEKIEIDKQVKDYFMHNNIVYYIDTTNKLFANDKEIVVEDTKFNKLLVKDGNIITTAETSDKEDNGKVYTFDTNGTKLNVITSKGSAIDRFDTPKGAFSDGEYIYIADTNNSRIIKRDNTQTPKREAISLQHKPVKVIAINNKIYYIDEDKNLYDSKNESIMEGVESFAAYGNNLLILSSNNVYINNKDNVLISGISFEADIITTAVDTNYAYIINTKSGMVAKYNLEKPETEIFITTIADAGRNYNIDYRGNLFVENDGLITKYAQTKINNTTSFEKVASFKINEKDLPAGRKISVAIDSINSNYYFTNIDAHLLYKIDGKEIGLDGTANSEIAPPADFDIIKTGIVNSDNKLAYLTPDNPESARIIKNGEVFLILAQAAEQYKDKSYYYVFSEYSNQYEYIATDEFEIFNNVDMHEQVMSSIVANVSVYQYPYKNASILLDGNGNEYKLNSKIQVNCILKIADGNIWDWYKIKFNDGNKTITGYVGAKYLTKVVPITPPKNIKFMRAKASKIGNSIKIYQEPNLECKVLFDDIKDGTDIQLVNEYDEKSTFTKVFYNNTIGYMLSVNLQAKGLTPNQIIAITITSVAIVAFTIIALLFIHKNKYSKKKFEETTIDMLE